MRALILLTFFAELVAVDTVIGVKGI